MSEPRRVYILRQLYEAGMLPMFSHAEEKISLHVLEALYQGGVHVVEFTNRHARALEIFRVLKKESLINMPGLVLGAGTVMNLEQAKAFAGEGADFIVQPVTDKAVGAFCTARDLFWCPGAATLNEIVQAHDLGADIVKLFPAEHLGGPGYLRAIMAPCPWLRLLPTGGVRPQREFLQPWFEAGARVVGISSRLFTPEILSTGAYGAITEQVAQVLHSIQIIQKQSK
ncbi:MAG TPA: hypothetical protein VMI35_01755 [Puia sp.]|nr:hypothetical protein [Puia sp.]